MNIKVIKDFRIGSNVFFSCYEDFSSKDIDMLCIIDSPLYGHSLMNLKHNGKDLFFLYFDGKDKLISDTLNCGVPMRVGKFLIKEFVDYIGFTIDDLKKLESMFNELDDKHKYEKIIYDAYIENGDFILTDEQRRKAYDEYLLERGSQNVS